MKPRSGEKPPFNNSSKSHMLRGWRVNDGRSRDASFSSSAVASSTIRSTSSPPWGWIKLEATGVFNIAGKPGSSHQAANRRQCRRDSERPGRSIFRDGWRSGAHRRGVGGHGRRARQQPALACCRGAGCHGCPFLGQGDRLRPGIPRVRQPGPLHDRGALCGGRCGDQDQRLAAGCGPNAGPGVSKPGGAVPTPGPGQRGLGFFGQHPHRGHAGACCSELD